jgi:hypothetical protein
MPDHDPLDSPAERRNGCLIITGSVTAAALVTLAITMLLAWRTTVSVTEESRRLAATIAAEFDRALKITPEVRVNSIVVVSPSAPIAELVVLEKKAVVRHTWSQTWLHSTKRLEIEATFTAKAGFDLTEPFRIHVDPVTSNVEANLPSPKILSLGMSDVRVLTDEDGLWNKLTPEDRTAAFQALEKQARRQFADSPLLAETVDEAKKRIRDIIAASGKTIDFAPKKTFPAP